MKKLKNNTQTVIVVLLAVLVLPMVYYFLYALPAHNQALLEFEQQKYEDELEAESARQSALESCIESAEQEYNEDSQAYAYQLNCNASGSVYEMSYEDQQCLLAFSAKNDELKEEKDQKIEYCYEQYSN